MPKLSALAVLLLLVPAPALAGSAVVVPLPAPQRHVKHRRPAAIKPASAAVTTPTPSAAAQGALAWAAGIAPTAVAVSAAPVVTGPRLSNLADLVFDGVVGENAPEVSADFTPGAMLGTTPLLFEKTTLDQLQENFGGLIHLQGDAGSTVSWLCYTRHAQTKSDVPTTAWFTSTGEMTGSGNTLSMVVVQQVDAAKVSGCATAPASFPFPVFGIPALGATLADLKTKFGALKRDRQHNAYYDSTRPVGDGTGASVYQTLGYVVGRKTGVVSGIAVSQVTTD